MLLHVVSNVVIIISIVFVILSADGIIILIMINFIGDATCSSIIPRELFRWD